jgi:secreted trypsin-like serine protease
MNKLLSFLVGGLLGVSVATTVNIYKLVNAGNSRDIHKLDMKFGTWPKNPKHYPIVHLADSTGRSFCTAFVIDAHYAATAGHCIENDDILKSGKLRTDTLKFLNERNEDLNTEAKAVGYDEWTDYGLLLGRFR